MKKIKVKTIFFSLISLVLIVFIILLGINFFRASSYSGKQSADLNFTGGSSPEQPTENDGSLGNNDFDSVVGEEGEKIISTFYLNFETIAFENDMSSLREMVVTYEGYIEASDIYQQGSYDGKNYKYGSLTIKIPKEKANAFIEEGKKKFHLVRENSNAQNVTLYYRDTKLRLDTLESQKNRLNELYEKAERIEDIISIESKLNEVILQIESIKGELQYLDRAVDYATITMSLNEVANLSNSPDIRASFTDRITVAFRDSIRFFKEASTDFAVFLVYALPFILIFLVILTLSLLLRRKKKAKKTVTTTKHSNDFPVNKE